MVSYSDPLQDYLPVKGSSLSLLHLATHYSGLPAIPLNLDAANPNPYAAYGGDALISFVKGYELIRAPGELYEYSNLGSGTLGYVLASISGKTCEELVSDTITRSLGMTDTVINVKQEQKTRFAQGYLTDGSPASHWDFDALAGCGLYDHTVAVPEETLKPYVGSYSLAPGYTFEVSIDQGHLMVRLTGQPSLEVFPETETSFFYKDVDAQISFERDSAGKVNALILHQGGISQRAERID